MLAKFGNVLIDENKITKYKKLSFYVFILGIIFFFGLPFLSNKIFITEKQSKNSEIFYNQFKSDFYSSELKRLKEDFQKVRSIFNSNGENLDSNSNILKKIDVYDHDQYEENLINKKLMVNLLSKKNEKEIQTVEIKSQRGDRLKFIMINVIYTRNLNPGNILFDVFSFINHFSSKYKSNYHWLSKDVQINFIEHELFYKDTKISLDLLTKNKNQKIKEGQVIDFILNIDTSQLNFNNLLLKINGANGEIIDMDFYKILKDNFSSLYKENKIRPFNSFFTNKTKKIMMKIYKQFADVMKLFLSVINKTNKEYSYENDFVYFIDNLFENYFHANEELDTNHLLISKGFNSVLIKSINPLNQADVVSNTRNFELSLKFLEGLERIIKIFSKSEIDLFRGDYNFILFNTSYFINIGIFLLVPVFLVIRIFYEILDNIYKIQDDHKEKQESKDLNKMENTKQSSKIVSVLLVSIFFQVISFLHIEQIKFQLPGLSYDTVFYSVLAFNFGFNFLIFFFARLNQKEQLLCDNLICFLFALNSFNFLFLNYGIGMILTIIFFPSELFFISFKNKLFKISGLILIVSIMVIDRNMIYKIILNYVEHFNNVYPIFTTIIAILFSRIGLILNNK